MRSKSPIRYGRLTAQDAAASSNASLDEADAVAQESTACHWTSSSSHFSSLDIALRIRTDIMGSIDGPELDVAIVGGGIAGVITALGLVKRGVRVKVFERAKDFHEIGAGLGFTASAEWAMKVVDPRIHVAFKKVATRNASDWFQYVDGQNGGDDIKLLFKLYLGERGFEGCSRPDFLDELGRLLPEGVIHFGSEFAAAREVDVAEGDSMVEVSFTDGTMIKADLVIGCDGIHSRLRPLVLGKENPASRAHYSHKYAIRGLIQMEQATASIGADKTSTRYMYLGPDAHMLTFPVAQGKFLNVVAFVTDRKKWRHQKLTAMTTRDEVSQSFVRFGPTVRKIVALLPESLFQWAVFDTFDHPASTYVKDNMVLVGDAAHASSPHHGAGAGCGIEDAAVLCTVLAMASRELQSRGLHAKKALIRDALDTYDTIRRERAAWMVESSRFIGELYEWQTYAADDLLKCQKETHDRCHKIWDYDIDSMIKQTTDLFDAKVGKQIE